MKLIVFYISLVLVVAAAAGGFLVTVLGVIPITASSGHWAVTAWFLNFSKHRSVSTHSLGVRQPAELDRPFLVLKGARHYEVACRPCHGSPNLRNPRITQHMTPKPPYLAPNIPSWKPRELFYLVKHGIKFTGMPAWPAQGRDDEVWAMVSFLMKFPHLDGGEYGRLAAGGNPPRGEVVSLADLSSPSPALLDNCGRCHGTREPGGAAFPKLAGQSFVYLRESLRAYARHERHSGIMEPVAAGLTEKEADELASYYARLGGTFDPALPAAFGDLGERMARHGLPEQGVPACFACHGPEDLPLRAAFPSLTGQHAEYLILQLELFKSDFRGGTAYAPIMQAIAARLTAEQICAVGHYIASLSFDRPSATSGNRR